MKAAECCPQFMHHEQYSVSSIFSVCPVGKGPILGEEAWMMSNQHVEQFSSKAIDSVVRLIPHLGCEQPRQTKQEGW